MMIGCRRSENRSAKLSNPNRSFADVWSDVENGSKASRGCKRRLCSVVCRIAIRADFPTRLGEPSSDGCDYGEASTVPTRRSSFPRSITPVEVAASDFTVMQRTAGEDRRSDVRTHTLSLRADVHQRRIGVALFLRVVRSTQRRNPESVLAIRWRTDASPNRLAQRRGSTTTPPKATDRSLRGIDGTLRHASPKGPTLAVPTRTAMSNRQTDISRMRIDQALLLRGSRDFPSREDYMRSLKAVIARAQRWSPRTVCRRTTTSSVDCPTASSIPMTW